MTANALNCKISPFVNTSRAFQRVPDAHPQPGHLRGVHHADHPWKHLPVGHPQRPPQARHVAPQLAAPIRTRLHLVHLWVWKVRVREDKCWCVLQKKYQKLAEVLKKKQTTLQQSFFGNTTHPRMSTFAAKPFRRWCDRGLCECEPFVLCTVCYSCVCASDSSGLFQHPGPLCERTFRPCIFVNQQSESERDQSVCTSLRVCVPGAGCVTQERVCSRSRRGRGRWSTSGSTRPRWPSPSSMRGWWRRWRRAPRYIFFLF